MLRIIDGMLVVRRELEKDITGRAPRKIITDMLSLQPGDTAIWCWDAPGSRKRRQALYPAYKSRRAPHPDGIWPLIDLVKKALVHTPSLQFEVPGYEADDIVGTLLRRYPGQRKHVSSTDRDLSQAFDNQTTSDFDQKIKVKPCWVRLYKTCVGDTSDCITGIPGFGEKTWDRADRDGLDHLVGQLVNTERPIEHIVQQNEYVNVAWGELPTRVKNWLAANRAELRAMWEIVGLYTVPEDELMRGMTPGRADFEKANALLLEFHH